MAEIVTIRNAALAARIAARGAELTSLVPAGGTEIMWSGDPAIWPWHAPNLFPIVGTLSDDTLVHRGRRYPMSRHGFLRRSLCEVADRRPESCAFRLTDNDATRAEYPFAFELVLSYRAEDDRLAVEFALSNPASEPLYASLGGHPAFRWPFGDAPRDAHVVLFDRPEPAPIRRLEAGLIAPEPIASPVEGRVLTLRDALFRDDALIFDRPASRRLTYGAPGGPALEFEFPDFPQLGIWTRPGPFLCLEPWQGYASPSGFAGEFAEKPGVAVLGPGETRRWRYAIRPLAVMPGIG
jgi:galactose mutarotase-like enzyme